MGFSKGRMLSEEAIKFIASKKYGEFLKALGKLNQEIKENQSVLDEVRTKIIELQAEHDRQVAKDEESLQKDREKFEEAKNTKEKQIVDFIVKEESDLDRKRAHVRQLQADANAFLADLVQQRKELKQDVLAAVAEKTNLLKQITLEKEANKKILEDIKSQRDQLREELKMQAEKVQHFQDKKNKLIDYLRKKGGQKWALE